MYFDEMAPGNKIVRDKPLTRSLKSPAIIAGSFEEMCSSKTGAQNPIKIKTRWLTAILLNFEMEEKFYYKKKKHEKFVHYSLKKFLLADKLLNNKCISANQHRFVLLKCWS